MGAVESHFPSQVLDSYMCDMAGYMRKAVTLKVMDFIDGWHYTNKYPLGRLCCLNIHKSHNYQISNRNFQLSVVNLFLYFFFLSFSFLFSLLTF